MAVYMKHGALASQAFDLRRILAMYQNLGLVVALARFYEFLKNMRLKFGVQPESLQNWQNEQQKIVCISAYKYCVELKVVPFESP